MNLMIDFKDGNYNNCSVENLKIVSNEFHNHQHVYLCREKGGYTLFTRRNIAAHLKQNMEWIDEHIRTNERFMIDDELYYISKTFVREDAVDECC